MKPALQPIFDALTALLRKHSKGLELLNELPGSKAKVRKPSVVLRGILEVSVFNQPPKQIWVAGVMLHKDYVGFYFMPYYGEPKSFPLSPTLKKCLKGKSCFHIKALDKVLSGEIDNLLKKGVAAFRKLGWI